MKELKVIIVIYNQEKYFDIYENKYVYLPTFQEWQGSFNQSLVFFIASFVLVRKNTITQNLKVLITFRTCTFLRFNISVYSIKYFSFFENDFMLFFIIFPALKCLLFSILR